MLPGNCINSGKKRAKTKAMREVKVPTCCKRVQVALLCS